MSNFKCARKLAFVEILLPLKYLSRKHGQRTHGRPSLGLDFIAMAALLTFSLALLSVLWAAKNGLVDGYAALLLGKVEVYSAQDAPKKFLLPIVLRKRDGVDSEAVKNSIHYLRDELEVKPYPRTEIKKDHHLAFPPGVTFLDASPSKLMKPGNTGSSSKFKGWFLKHDDPLIPHDTRAYMQQTGDPFVIILNRRTLGGRIENDVHKTREFFSEKGWIAEGPSASKCLDSEPIGKANIVGPRGVESLCLLVRRTAVISGIKGAIISDRPWKPLSPGQSNTSKKSTTDKSSATLMRFKVFWKNGFPLPDEPDFIVPAAVGAILSTRNGAIVPFDKGQKVDFSIEDYVGDKHPFLRKRIERVLSVSFYRPSISACEAVQDLATKYGMRKLKCNANERSVNAVLLFRQSREDLSRAMTDIFNNNELTFGQGIGCEKDVCFDYNTSSYYRPYIDQFEVLSGETVCGEEAGTSKCSLQDISKCQGGANLLPGDDNAMLSEAESYRNCFVADLSNFSFFVGYVPFENREKLGRLLDEIEKEDSTNLKGVTAVSSYLFSLRRFVFLMRSIETAAPIISVFVGFAIAMIIISGLYNIIHSRRDQYIYLMSLGWSLSDIRVIIISQLAFTYVSIFLFAFFFSWISSECVSSLMQGEIEGALHWLPMAEFNMVPVLTNDFLVSLSTATAVALVLSVLLSFVYLWLLRVREKEGLGILVGT